jgi:hypothetical protein
MVKMNWKTVRLAVTALALCAGVGCGGFNGSYNVSPASFLLPGFGHVPASTNSTVHTFAAVE